MLNFINTIINLYLIEIKEFLYIHSLALTRLLIYIYLNGDLCDV